MITQSFYISWYTWLADPVTTPWDFWFLSQGSRYRPRDPQNSGDLSRDEIAAAFSQQNAEKLEQLEQHYINDVKLLAFVEAVDQEDAKRQVVAVFPDAEIEKALPVDPTTKSAILNLISQSLAAAKPQERP